MQAPQFTTNAGVENVEFERFRTRGTVRNVSVRNGRPRDVYCLPSRDGEIACAAFLRIVGPYIAKGTSREW